MTTVWDYYGEPEPFELLAAASKFFQVALTAHERFSALPAYETDIQLIPLDEHGGKRPLSGFLPSRQAIPKTTEALALMASVCPDANVGVSSRRAVGAIIVIDCDEPGVLERIQRETGRRLPLTYTTLTRPRSAPHKRHVIFMSTEYSCDRIRKQVTDVTRVTGYDLKGCGGFGHVAAEGCVRDGEPVVALHDVPICPIPEWLVDFLVADIARARDLKIGRSKPAPELEPTCAVVSRDDRNWAVLSRIRTMKNIGFSDDAVLAEVTRQIKIGFEGGDQLLTTAYIRKLRALIRRVPSIGVETSLRNLTRHRRIRRSSIPLSALRERFLCCPQDISPADARVFFFVRNRADHERLRREFRRHGFVYSAPHGSRSGVWSRYHAALNSSTEEKPSSSVSNNTLTLTTLFLDSFKGAQRSRAPQHREVCMRKQTPEDQNVADEVLIHTRNTQNPGKNGGGMESVEGRR